MKKTILLAAASLLAITTFGTSPALADGTPECNINVFLGSLECGVNASATGSGTAVGALSTAASQGTAVGFNATAAGAGSVALGEGSSAVAQGTAIGFEAEANAIGSVALGDFSVANEADTVSVGQVGAERKLVNVAAGVNATDAVNMGQLNTTNTNVTANSIVIATLNTTVGTHTTEIATLNTTVGTLNTTVGTLNTTVGTLNTTVGTHETTIATHTTQITGLQAFDAAIDNRADALEAIALDFADDLDRVDDRASAGTATAIALGGATFLPDKKFNLSGNVGLYRGAYAGAMNINALVSQNAAINAGVGYGFNKGGKFGARAGFTFGW